MCLGMTTVVVVQTPLATLAVVTLATQAVVSTLAEMSLGPWRPVVLGRRGLQAGCWRLGGRRAPVPRRLGCGRLAVLLLVLRLLHHRLVLWWLDLLLVHLLELLLLPLLPGVLMLLLVLWLLELLILLQVVLLKAELALLRWRFAEVWFFHF